MCADGDRIAPKNTGRPSPISAALAGSGAGIAVEKTTPSLSLPKDLHYQPFFKRTATEGTREIRCECE